MTLFRSNNDLVIAKSNNDKIIDFSIDYKSNLYLLVKSSDNKMQIEKYTNGQLVNTIVLNNNNYINLELDIKQGNFYLIDQHLSAIRVVSINDFVDNLSRFANDTSFISHTPSSEQTKVASIKSSTFVYQYPFTISPLLELKQNEQVIIIEEECEENNEFSYCLIANQNEKNILGYIQKSALNFYTSDITPAFEKVKIITAYAYLYKMPTSLKFQDNKDLKLDKMAYQNEEYNVVGYAYGYKDSTNNTYYTIKLDDDTYAYVKSFNAMNSELDVYQATFQPNAHLSTINNNDTIYLYKLNDNNEYEITSIKLDNNIKVYVAGEYNTENEYTKIVYLNNNNEQLSAYIQTKYIVMDGITKHIQIGIILLFASLALIIIVIIYLMKYIKQRKIEENLNKID